MAGIRYASNYKSMNGWEYDLKIWDTHWAGSEQDFTIGESVSIKYDSSGDAKLAPIICSSLEFGFMVEDAPMAAWIASMKTNAYAEKDVYCTLTKTTSQGVWGGYLILDLGNEEDVSYPYEVKMKFIDGLALLKDIDFIPDPSSYTSPYNSVNTYLNNTYTSGGNYKSVVWWLSQILANAGISSTATGGTDYRIVTANNWYNQKHAGITSWATKDPLKNTAINAQQFYKQTGDDNSANQILFYTSLNCYEALISICSTFGLRCIYYHNKVTFIQVGLYNTAETGTTAVPVNIQSFNYDNTGTAISTSTKIGGTNIERYQLDIEDSADLGLQKLAGGNWGEYPPVKKAIATFPSVSNFNYFQAFPLIYGTDDFDSTGLGTWPSLYPTGTGNVNEMSSTIGTFTDAHNIQAWYCQIYLEFKTTIPVTPILSRVRWTIRAKPSASSWTTADALVLVNEYNTTTSAWEQTWEPFKELADQEPEELSFWDNSGGSTGTLGGTVSNDLCSCDIHSMANTQIEEIVSQSRLGLDYNHLVVPHASMTGDWDFEFYTLAAAINYVPPATSNYFSRADGNGSRALPNGVLPDPPFSSFMMSFPPWYKAQPDNDAIFAPWDHYYSNVNNSSTPSVFSIVSGGSIQSGQQNTSITAATEDTFILELKNILWGDTSSTNSAGSLLVYDGTNWVFTDFVGQWGRGIITGTDSLSELLCREAMNMHPSYTSKFNLTLATSSVNRDFSTNVNYPKFVNPIGRITNAAGTVDYVFSRGDFNTATDEVSGMWWEMSYSAVTGTVVVNDDNGDNGGGIQGNITGSGLQYNMGQINTTGANMMRSQTLNTFTNLGTTIEAGVAITSIDINAYIVMPVEVKAGDKIRLQGDYQPPSDGLTSGTNYITLTVSADVAAYATTISVDSFTPDQIYWAGTPIMIDQKNLFEQYQRKTEGTIGGMAVTSDSIGKLEYKGGVYSFAGVDPIYVKILPRDFMINDDGSDEALNFKDSSNSGVQVGTAAQEMLATVNIPYGTTATEVYIWGSNTTKTVEVYECGIATNGIGSVIGTGTTNGSAISITDTAATTTNYLLILVKVNAASQRIYGGKVTLTQN